MTYSPFFAAGIRWALTDVDRRARLSRQSRIAAVAKFACSLVAEQYLHLRGRCLKALLAFFFMKSSCSAREKGFGLRPPDATA